MRLRTGDGIGIYTVKTLSKEISHVALTAVMRRVVSRITPHFQYMQIQLQDTARAENSGTP